MLEEARTGNKYSGQILGYTHSQSLAVVGNQWAMEFTGQQFKTSHRSLPRNSNLWVEVDNTEIKPVKKIKINKMLNF